MRSCEPCYLTPSRLIASCLVGLFFLPATLKSQEQPAPDPCPIVKYSEVGIWEAILEAEVEGRRQENLERLLALYDCAWQVHPLSWNALQVRSRGWARELGRYCSEGCLVPMITLMQDAVVALASRGALEMSWEVRKFMERILASILLPTMEKELGRAVAARLWARMGLLDRELVILEVAREELLKAVQLQPSYLPSLYALATLDEKLGLYSTAKIYLRRLTELNPQDELIQLRLALVELRLSRKPKAREHLRQLRSSAKTSWVAELAEQELIQALLATGQREEAASLLEEARRRFPGSQGLAVQGAFWFDISLSTSISSNQGDLGVNPRTLYNEWPEAEVAPLFQALKEDLERGRSNLELGLSLIRFNTP